jgi:4-amino-4-deoxy-L-arabinose transferase-like glycosyltransferase
VIDDDIPQPDQAPLRPFSRTGLAVSLLVVVAAWAPLQLLGLGAAPFHTKGEPREAVVVADILQRGEWILPRRNAVDLPAKPPLFHWLAALASQGLGGISELAVRLPSALQSLGAALLLLIAASVLYGARCGLLASLTLLTSFEWLRAATSARVDMTLAFGLTCTFIGLLLLRHQERMIWRFLVYVGLTWAVLAKGPVGIALPILQVVLICLLDRSTELLRRLRPVRGLVVVLILAGTWYGLATAQGGYDFFAKQILDENVYRFLGSRNLTGGHRHSALYLAAMLVVGFLPWSLFLPILVRDAQRREERPRPDPRRFVVTWVVVVFAFYAIPASKRGVYLLPLYPALSLLLAIRLDSFLRGEGSLRGLRPGLMLAGGLLVAVSTAAALAAAGDAAAIPLLSAIGSFLPGGGGADFHRIAQILSSHGAPLAAYFAAAAATSLVLFLAARNRRWGTSFVAIVFSVAILGTSVRLLILPELANQRTRRNFVTAVRSTLSDPGALSAYRNFDYGMVYYWGKPIPMEHTSLSSSGPRYLVMSESEWVNLDKQERRSYERLPGLESSRGGNLGRLIVAQRIAPAVSESH